MIEDPLSSAQLGIAPEEFIDQEPLSVTPSVVPPLEINTPPLEPGDEIPLPTSAELNLVPNSIFSRSYDAMNQLAQTGQPITPRSVALIALANEIAAGLSISDAEFKVSNNIYAQRKSFFKNHGIEIETYKSEEHGLAFKPQKTTEPKTFRTPKSEADKNTESTPDLQKEPIKPRLSAFEIDIYSHPERFGEEGSDVRRTAEILFSRALANRGSSRELILEDFAPGYLLDHPGASQKTISNAFGRSIVLLEQALKERDSSFRIPRSTGNSKNSILKIDHDSIPLPITTQEEAKQISVDKETETEGEEQETIDTSVFGVSKTTLIQYLLSSNKARTLTDISVIRRKDGKTGPVLTAEMNTTRMVVSTLQLELPKGVELRNSLDQNNKPLPDQFEVYPKDIIIQQIIKLKKNEIEAARSIKEAEQLRIADENAAHEAERSVRFEKMRAEALAARAEREAAERAASEAEQATTSSELLPDQPETKDERGEMMLESGLLGVVESLVDGEVIKLNRLFEGKGLTLSTQDNGGVGLFVNFWLSLEGDDYSQEAMKRTMLLLNPKQIDSTEPEPEVIEPEPESPAENSRLTELKESGILDVIETAASSDGTEPSLASTARIVIPESRSRRDVPTRQVQMRPDVQQNLAPKQPETPKKPESLKKPEISFKNGKVEMSGAHLETFSTLMSIADTNGIKPRDLAQIITRGKAKGDIIPATERRLKELMEAFKETPIKITHPVDEFGIVDDRRFLLEIPEGVNPLHYISR